MTVLGVIAMALLVGVLVNTFAWLRSRKRGRALLASAPARGLLSSLVKPTNS